MGTSSECGKRGGGVKTVSSRVMNKAMKKCSHAISEPLTSGGGGGSKAEAESCEQSCNGHVSSNIWESKNSELGVRVSKGRSPSAAAIAVTLAGSLSLVCVFWPFWPVA